MKKNIFSGENIVACMSIVGLVTLESIALLTHTDGAFFMPIVAAIAGIAGYKIYEVKEALK